MKLLTKSAVVPSSLYVLRSADRQIDSIVAGMGRPGYVLVARQMGKTNSLLHAKRRLEDENVRFAYVDLSNPPSDSRTCFRSITDTVIDSHPDFFSGVRGRIDLIRSRSDLPPNKEHERELLQLLQLHTGNLIIILDEIDALVNTSYSDEIFAQIRSIYFSRVTFDAFGRLSYLLSGVVEPSQLIKDPRRSPFNIGEKIYLDDFGVREVKELAEKAQLPLSETVIQRVFEWTGGHPRMTWEVCSELEDLYGSQGEIDDAAVDRIVERLYLKRFDLPPIDHIRGLVRVDHEIRGAIRVLHTHPAPEIPDEIERKLYLSGVLTIDPTGATRIKNRVFREALSIRWLDEVESRGDVLPSKADEQFTLRNYEAAIGFYVQFLEERKDLPIEIKAVCYHQIGLCYRLQNQADKAIEYFNKCEWDVDHNPTEYYRLRFNLGLCFLQKGDNEKSAALFQEVAVNHSKSILRCKALLNYGAAVLHTAAPDATTQAEQTFKRLLEELSLVDFTDLTELADLKLVAWFNIAQIRVRLGDLEMARNAFREAIAVAGASYAPSIALELLSNETDAESRRSTIREIVEIIEKSRLRFSDVRLRTVGVDLPPYNFDVLLKLIVAACGQDLLESAIGLIDQALALGSIQGGGRAETMVKISTPVRALDQRSGLMLLEEARRILMPMVNESAPLAREVSANLLIDKANRRASSARDQAEFVTLVLNSAQDSKLTEADFHAFIHAAAALRLEKRYELATQVCLKYVQLAENGGEPSERNLFIVYFFLAHLWRSRGVRREARAAALESRRLIERHPAEMTSVIGAAGLSELKKGIDHLLQEVVQAVPFRHSVARVGRNDPCPCGSGKKFKKCHGA